MRKLLLGVIILAVLLVAADRISAAVAENQISDRLTSAYGLAGKPGVTITGFPFLTGSGISVTPVHVSVPGVATLPSSAYSSQLHVEVPLSTLPLHLRLTSVHVTPGGLRIGAAARHVQFARE